MYEPCTYERFSISTPKLFEKRLIQWCDEVYVPNRSMIVFDREALKVNASVELYEIDQKLTYKVTLDAISFAYICVNQEMCAMYKIWENNPQCVLYNMPKQWRNVELWIGI